MLFVWQLQLSNEIHCFKTMNKFYIIIVGMDYRQLDLFCVKVTAKTDSLFLHTIQAEKDKI